MEMTMDASQPVYKSVTNNQAAICSNSGSEQ